MERYHWVDLGVDVLIKLGWFCWKRGVYRFLEGKPEGK